jgi:hypothetical protein
MSCERYSYHFECEPRLLFVVLNDVILLTLYSTEKFHATSCRQNLRIDIQRLMARSYICECRRFKLESSIERHLRGYLRRKQLGLE